MTSLYDTCSADVHTYTDTHTHTHALLNMEHLAAKRTVVFPQEPESRVTAGLTFNRNTKPMLTRRLTSLPDEKLSVDTLSAARF